MNKNIANALRNLCAAWLLLLAALGSSAQNGDINLLRSINHRRNNSEDKVMIGLTNSVYPISGAIPVGGLIVGYAGHNKDLVITGWQAVEGLALNTVLTFGLKYAVDRKRPYITYSDITPYQHDKDASFPSGHSSFSFYSATTLSLSYPKWYVIAPSYIWAATVGYSRMYLGMHYPTDVLAGAVIGAGSSWLAYKGNRWLQHHKRKRTATE